MSHRRNGTALRCSWARRPIERLQGNALIDLGLRRMGNRSGETGFRPANLPKRWSGRRASVPAVRVQTRNRVECAVIGLSEDRDAVAENLHDALASAADVHCRRGCRYVRAGYDTHFFRASRAASRKAVCNGSNAECDILTTAGVAFCGVPGPKGGCGSYSRARVRKRA
jgi:hypothetical protein